MVRFYKWFRCVLFVIVFFFRGMNIFVYIDEELFGVGLDFWIMVWILFGEGCGNVLLIKKYVLICVNCGN